MEVFIVVLWIFSIVGVEMYEMHLYRCFVGKIVAARICGSLVNSPLATAFADCWCQRLASSHLVARLIWY